MRRDRQRFAFFLTVASCLAMPPVARATEVAPLIFHTGPFIEANPCPVPFGIGDGQTILRWDAKSPTAEITVNTGGPEQQISTSPAGMEKIPWINIDAVYEFRMYRGVGRKDLIAMVRVTRNHADPNQPLQVAAEANASAKEAPDRDDAEKAANIPVSHSESLSKAHTIELFIAFTLLALSMIAVGARRDKAGRSARLLWAYPAGLVLLAGVLGGINLWWLEHFRRGMPLDIDESQFYVDAIDQAGYLRHGNFGDFTERYERSSWHSPLLPLSLALCAVPLGDDPFLGYAVLHAYYILLLLATYGIARRFCSPSAALLAAFVVATTPGIIYYCRTFFVELPAATLYTAAIYAMLRSEQGRNLKWSTAMGFCVGLTNLMRPLCLALAPAFYLALGLQWLIDPSDRRKRIVNVAVALLIGIATSGTWYFYFHDRNNLSDNNLSGALKYLTSFGYGAHTTFYNDGRVTFAHPLAILTYRLRVIVNQGFFLPLALVLAALGIWGLVVRYRRRSPAAFSKQKLMAVANSSASTLAIVTVYVYAMLTSSLNEGDGFMLVILPVFAIAPIALFWDAAGRRLRIAATALLVMLGIFHTIMQADLSKALAESSSIFLPEIGELRVRSGSGRVQEGCSYVGFTGSPTHIPAEYRKWMRLNNEVLSHIASQTRLSNAQVVVGLRDPVFNFSTLELVSRCDFGYRLETDVFQLEDTFSPEHPAALKDYYKLLNSRLLDPDFLGDNRIYLILGEQTAKELQPAINQDLSAQAAQQLGFKQGLTLLMPDGRRMAVWERDRKISH